MMGTWTIGVQISGSRIDGEGLARLEDVFEREFPDYEADCALWSGLLGVHTTVRSPTPGEGLDAALRAISLAFDEAEVDMKGTSEIISVTMRRVLRPTAVPDTDSLSKTLLGRLSPSHRR